MQRDWKTVTLPKLNRTVTRLGVAPNYGLRSADIGYAAERGVNYWVFSASAGERWATSGLKELLKRDRDKHVVAVLGAGYFPWMVRWSIDRARKALGVDTLDIFQLGWLGVSSALTPSIEETLLKAKEEGKIRAIGTSIHDRPRAAHLAEEGCMDMLMLRYNAAHPGAEREIFPHLAARDPLIVAYTGTSWGQLLKAQPSGLADWPGPGSAPPLTAPLCYRFQLQSPHVHVAITGPGSRAQLDENLGALDDGPLSAAQEAWIREYGRHVAKKALPGQS